MQTILAIQAATNEARARLDDKTIATRVESGKIQVVRVTYPNGPAGVVAPVSGWMPAAEVCGYLAKLQ